MARSSGLSLVMHNKRDDSVDRIAIDIFACLAFSLMHLCISSLRNAMSSSYEDYFVLRDKEKSKKSPKQRKSKTVVTALLSL